MDCKYTYSSLDPKFFAVIWTLKFFFLALLHSSNSQWTTFILYFLWTVIFFFNIEVIAWVIIISYLFTNFFPRKNDTTFIYTQGEKLGSSFSVIGENNVLNLKDNI